MAKIGPGRPLVMPAAMAACLLFGTAPTAAAAADDSPAVTTPGTGALTICRDWVVYESCSTYHKIDLPGRIAVGDRIELTYGSNPKDYVFHVSGIRRDANSCTILSENSGPGDKGERIEVAPCAATK